jgi:hypothetical protein
VRQLVALVGVLIVACSAGEDDGSAGSAGNQYAPCNGEPNACPLATVRGDASGSTACLCRKYCQVDTDCPLPATGTATPICVPFGDVVENGHTAACSLPCDAFTTCPSGMECQSGECWAPAAD